MSDPDHENDQQSSGRPTRRATPRPTYDVPTRMDANHAERHLWGDDESGFVVDLVYLSSEHLHVLDFSLPPGGHFGHSPNKPDHLRRRRVALRARWVAPAVQSRDRRTSAHSRR